MSEEPYVLFVCLHGAAKSVVAAHHLQRLAAERALRLAGESAGIEPYATIPAEVMSGLRDDGLVADESAPRLPTPEAIAGAAHVVAFGCDLGSLADGRAIERWDDVPDVSDGYEVARDVIVRRVSALLDDLTRRGITAD